MKTKEFICIPKSALTVTEALGNNGFDAYVVGGYVRDSLLGLKPKDCDIATNSKPEQVMEIFEKLNYMVIPTGLKHGTVTVLVDGEPIEITTFRTESEYTNGRHPDKVEFVSDLYSDLSRRDFTVNAFAYHPTEGLIDLFGGKEDLENKVIRCVGSPDERFQEDALRMLRAVRFASKLPDFEIDDFTFFSIQKNAELINKVSAERVRAELNQIIMSDARGLTTLKHIGLLKHVLPEFDLCYDCKQNHPAHNFDVARHSVVAMCNISPVLHLRLAMLFHDIGKPFVKTTDENGIDHFYEHPKTSMVIAEIAMKRLKYDNETIEKVLTLIKYHDVEFQVSKGFIKRMLNKIGEELFRDLLLVRIADVSAQNPAFLAERTIKIDYVKSLLEIVIKEEQAFSLKHLAINGKDLIDVGFKEGRMIGAILNDLLEIVIDNPEHNTKEKLLKLAEIIGKTKNC